MVIKTIARTTSLMAMAAMATLAVEPASAQYRDQNQYDGRYQNQGPYSQGQSQDRNGQRQDRGRDSSNQYQAPDRRDERPAAVNNERNNPDARWRQRYSQTYTFNDDAYYRECRSSTDPAGVIAGALIGGLLGNAVGHGNGGATVAGIIVGGATGAALTKNLNCEDRSYAYKTYHDGFNNGRANATYRWRNPNDNHYGTFRVGSYYQDPGNFRCATYSQQIFVNGRPQTTSGRACQQPDSSWVIVG